MPSNGCACVKKMVPTGWQMVPVEPTKEMIEAAASFGGRGGYSKQRGDESADAYRDMLSAAPSQDEGKTNV